jgi:bifunctional UDP-N-acetylglucosamine pyrophosphorylase/glucosamine-1-phosphate N-acetyltransferase
MTTRPARSVLESASPVEMGRQGSETRSKSIGAIVMAAGLGKRMRSKLGKVLHPIAGRPMVLYVVDLAERLTNRGVVVVVGHQGEQVKSVVEAHGAATASRERLQSLLEPAQGQTNGTRDAHPVPVQFAMQAQQLGTGHAVMQARDVFKQMAGGPAGSYLILNGDTPLLSEHTVQALLKLHAREDAAVTLLTVNLPDPTGYGRVVRTRERSNEGDVLRIVEDKDTTAAEASITEINVGTYVVDGPFLFEALDQLQPKNAQKEYYLTDIIEMAVKRGLRVCALAASDVDEGMGINTRRQLAAAERVIRRRLCDRWMEAGVTMLDPDSTWIDHGVEIGRDTVLHPHVTLEGRTTIGEDCVIRSHSRVTDSVLGQHVLVQDSCVLREARLEDHTTVGPFAHLRPGAVLRRSAKVGNFVEIKKSELGEGSKANHLSYLGDAKIGKDVNIGAGTITCNYDGFKKCETVIENGVFIGSDTQLIAPVKVGRGAIVAAGSSITDDIPADALAVARARQVTIPGWAETRRAVQTGVNRETSNVKRGEKSDRLTRHASRVTKKPAAVSKSNQAKNRARS